MTKGRSSPDFWRTLGRAFGGSLIETFDVKEDAADALVAFALGMAMAAVFLALFIAYKMTDWHSVTLALVTLLIMHGIVYTLGFRGQEDIPEGTTFWRAFSQFTLVGYAIALLVSSYVLCSFGRLPGGDFGTSVITAVVLA